MLEKGSQLCASCAGNIYTMALEPFTCKECGASKVAKHGGYWQYCDVCAQKLGCCAMCGKKLSSKFLK